MSAYTEVMNQPFGHGAGPNNEAGYLIVTKWAHSGYDITRYHYDMYGGGSASASADGQGSKPYKKRTNTSPRVRNH